jgi:branched-chain amino acid transport system permease protein
LAGAIFQAICFEWRIKVLSPYVANLMVTVSTFILLSWACYLPLRGGQLYNGPIFSAALAGYFAAYTAKVLGWPVPVCFIGGIIFSGLFSFGLSFVLAPLTMFQMSVVTIALIFIFQTTFRNMSFLGGVTGMSGIPEIKSLLWICCISILVGVVLLNRLSSSRWGRAMEAVEVDRDMASTMGVDVISMSIVLQVSSGIIGGLAGVIYTFNLGSVHPEIFGFGQLLYCFTILIIGGRDTPWGILFFAPILWLFPEFFPGALAEFRNVAYGLIVIVFLLVSPRGVVTRKLIARIEGAYNVKK